MSGVRPFLSYGAQIDSAVSKVLQDAVCDRLMKQAEEVLLSYALSCPNPGSSLVGLQALSSLPSERRNCVLLHPSFRYWLQAVRRTSRSGKGSELRHEFALRLSDFIWSEELVAGRPVRTWQVMTDDEGGLRCPTFGRYIELGDAYRHQTLQVTVHNAMQSSAVWTV